MIGSLEQSNLQTWLKTFADPRTAVREEVDSIKSSAVVPDWFIVHGMIYDLASGRVETVINGYEERRMPTD